MKAVRALSPAKLLTDKRVFSQSRRLIHVRLPRPATPISTDLALSYTTRTANLILVAIARYWLSEEYSRHPQPAFQKTVLGYIVRKSTKQLMNTILDEIVNSK